MSAAISDWGGASPLGVPDSEMPFQRTSLAEWPCLPKTYRDEEQELASLMSTLLKSHSPDRSKRCGPSGPFDAETSSGALAAPAGVQVEESEPATKKPDPDQSGNGFALDLSQMMVPSGPFTFSIRSHGCYHFFEDGRATVVRSGGDEAEGMRRRGEMCQLSTEICQLACTVCFDGIDDEEYRRDILSDLQVEFFPFAQRTHMHTFYSLFGTSYIQPLTLLP